MGLREHKVGKTGQTHKQPGSGLHLNLFPTPLWSVLSPQPSSKSDFGFEQQSESGQCGERGTLRSDHAEAQLRGLAGGNAELAGCEGLTFMSALTFARPLNLNRRNKQGWFKVTIVHPSLLKNEKVTIDRF